MKCLIFLSGKIPAKHFTCGSRQIDMKFYALNLATHEINLIKSGEYCCFFNIKICKDHALLLYCKKDPIY